MKRKFITNLALLLFLNLLVKPFWIFGIDRTVQNMVGAVDFGFYFSLFNFSIILNVILDMGISNYNNRNIARHSQLLSKYLSNIIVLKFILAVAYMIISLSLALLIGYNMHQMHLLLFLVFNQFLISFSLYLRSNISGLQMFATDSMLSVLDKALMIIICSLLLWGHVLGTAFKIEWFVYAQTIAYLTTTLVILFIVLRKAGTIRLKYNFNYLRVIMKQTLPFALLVLLMASYNSIYSVLLERILVNGKEQAGIYAQALRIPDAVTMFGFLFAGLLLPMFSRMIKMKEPVQQLIQLSTLLIIVPAIILSFGSLFYRIQIMGLLYKEHVAVSSGIYAMLMFSFVFITITYIFGTLLTANGNLKELNIMAATGLAVNVILNFILIPKYQAAGSAVASLVTQSFTALAQLFIASRVFRFKVDFRLIMKLALFTLAVVLLGYLSVQLPYHWVLRFTGFIALCCIIAFLTRLINLKALYRLVWSNEG
ncbi:MAG: polysaccharide biosynthesis C-terminal domain-containing protein [Bacteroidia bacterium]|nr:polysaccharide biosynthesis C-terminal domain-containing protein [Bacteroidia bacterium]